MRPDEVAIALAPAWLLALAQRETAGREGSSTGGVIREGQRNSVLARLAGAMRRQGMTEAEVRAALLAVNADRCVPPLPEREVERIAASIARYD